MGFTQLCLLALFNAIFSKIYVRSPSKLKDLFKESNHTIKIGLSNFGKIPYGNTIMGKVYYKLDNDTEAKSFGCDRSDLPLLPFKYSVDEAPMIMVDRGECSFVRKVENAERAGAFVALVINNNTGKEESDASKLSMAGYMNYRSEEIKIPGVIISKQDGDIIKQFMRENPSDVPLLEVEFTMENKTNVVHFEIWYTPDQEEVYKLLGEFFTYQKALKNHTALHIHIYTYTHFDYKTNEKGNFTDCLSRGRYCIRPVLNDFLNDSRYHGHELAAEGVRQLCIHNYANAKGEPELFWAYMMNFYEDCYKKNNISPYCSMLSLKQAKIDGLTITSCYAKSFGFEGKSIQSGDELELPNSLLEKEEQLKKEMYVSAVPSLFINKRFFQESLRGELLFEAICSSLLHKPDFCYVDGYFAKENGYSTSTIIGIIVLIIALNAFLFYFCIRFIRRNVQDKLASSNLKHQVEDSVRNYIKMREGPLTN